MKERAIERWKARLFALLKAATKPDWERVIVCIVCLQRSSYYINPSGSLSALLFLFSPSLIFWFNALSTIKTWLVTVGAPKVTRLSPHVISRPLKTRQRHFVIDRYRYRITMGGGDDNSVAKTLERVRKEGLLGPDHVTTAAEPAREEVARQKKHP